MLCIIDKVMNYLRQCICVIINKLFVQEIWYKIKTVAPYNHWSMQVEHGIKS